MDLRYRERSGAVLRSLINDLKRDDVSAARELGVELAELRSILDGRAELPEAIVRRAVEIWPVNERDFHAVRDDCPDGVILMRAAQSRASSRTLQRAGRDYYEYRDTAMSRVAMFRPEWIEMLQVVDGDDVADPRVQWNNGHLLHQFTYFVGNINYYYEWRGHRHCAAMGTGDSIWGMPFSPHTFAARGPQRPRHILALTYGAGLVGEVQHELGVLGAGAARRYALPIDDERAAEAAQLGSHLANAALTTEALAELAAVPPARLDDLLSGEVRMTGDERDRLAAALGVHPVHLTGVAADTRDGIRMLRAADVLRWGYPSADRPDYRVGRLAGSHLHPLTHGLELDVLRGRGGASPAALETGLHQYVYCLGPGSAVLAWEHAGRDFEEVIGPEDSLYVKPFVPLRMARLQAEDPVRLLVLRIAGKTRAEAMTELGGLTEDGIDRVVREHRQWYDPAAPAGKEA
jgi:hypothetical protein